MEPEGIIFILGIQYGTISSSEIEDLPHQSASKKYGYHQTAQALICNKGTMQNDLGFEFQVNTGVLKPICVMGASFHVTRHSKST